MAFGPQFITPYQQLAGLVVEDGKWSEVLANTNHTLQLDSAGTPQIWFYDALANFQLGKTNMAEASALKSLTMDPSHSVPNTEQLLAVILAQRRDYAGAIAHLRNCLIYLPSGPGSNLVKEQIAQLEVCQGRRSEVDPFVGADVTSTSVMRDFNHMAERLQSLAKAQCLQLCDGSCLFSNS